ncbi:TIGR02588 family protein [Indioceanicola profundi]|uniref:TIGR02588 family protein n=1 Tax=Indioceanicola profundi TaxID=2220096 RepID=UPI000E6A9A1A|nr:TIGR02588 family protein [Indioceanicola profundi]
MGRASIPERIQGSSTSPWEWAVGLLGLAALAGIIGYMAWFALSSRSYVPAITVEKVHIQQSGNSFVVQFMARNDSAATAASLKIEGELHRDGKVVETAETEIDYLPPYSRREAGLFFQEDPTLYELRLIPKGYDAP